MEEKIIVGEQDIKVDLIDSFPNHEYSAKDEHPDRFELNSAAAQIEQSNRRN